MTQVGRNLRIEGRIAIVELRSLLVADAHIELPRRRRLITAISYLVVGDVRARKFPVVLDGLLNARFGRNPDTFEVSEPTLRALNLLDGIQSGRSSELSMAHSS